MTHDGSIVSPDGAALRRLEERLDEQADALQKQHAEIATLRERIVMAALRDLGGPVLGFYSTPGRPGVGVEMALPEMLFGHR